MHIQTFVIENFKRFRRVELACNADLNVLTGVNNSGKTSLLEALALWAECFQKLVRVADRRAKGAVQYRLGDPKSNYFQSDEIHAVRSTAYGDIFHDLADDVGDVLLLATLGPPHADGGATKSLTVGFKIRAARGSIYDIVLADAAAFDLKLFNAYFSAFPQPVRSTFVSPVAAIAAREEFYTVPSVRARVLARDSARVVRNRLYQLKKRPERYQALLDDLSFVLFNRARPVALQFDGDETEDVDLAVRIQLDVKEPFRDLCLLGSGALQILEILLGVHAERQDLNLILLDEPDSHLHRDLQRRLVDTLLRYTASGAGSPVQLFLTTHNEGLIRSTRPEHLFHLEDATSKAYRPIAADAVGRAARGLQPSRHIKVLQSLGNETALDFLNALEADRLVVVEGDDDARYLQAIVERESPRDPFRAMYWTFQGIDTLLARLDHYRTGIFEVFRNHRSLWEKTALIFDADYVTEAERASIADALRRKSGYATLPTLLWPAYTIEATVLVDLTKFAQIIGDLIVMDTGAAPPANLITAVDAAVANLRSRLTTRLGEQGFLKSIEGQRWARRKNFEEGLGIKAPRDPALSAYLPDASERLRRGEVHHLATKDDLADLIEDTYTTLGLPFVRDGLFDRVIAATTPATRPAVWGEVARLLRAPLP